MWKMMKSGSLNKIQCCTMYTGYFSLYKALKIGLYWNVASAPAEIRPFFTNPDEILLQLFPDSAGLERKCYVT